MLIILGAKDPKYLYNLGPFMKKLRLNTSIFVKVGIFQAIVLQVSICLEKGKRYIQGKELHEAIKHLTIFNIIMNAEKIHFTSKIFLLSFLFQIFI